MGQEAFKRRYPLTNMTEGGEGASGAKRSEETKKKMSETRKGKTTDKLHNHIMNLVEKCQQPVAILDVDNNVINVFRSKADCARFYNTTITLVRTYSEPDIPKLWKKQNVYIRKITLEEYNNYSLNSAA